MIPGIWANKKGTLLQTAVQYNVSGSLDGTEAAPSVINGSFDEEGVLQIDVDDLGIIDPDLMGGIASRADRFVIWIRVESPVPFGAGFRISRVNASQLVPSLGIIELQRITPASVVGERIFTTTECFTVPQGQAIQITGMGAAPAGIPYHVSMGLRLAASGDDEARLAAMCCCQIGASADGGGGDEGAIVSRDTFSFSAQQFSTSGSDGGTYFGFSSYYFSPTPLTFMQQSEAIFNADEGSVSPSAEKIAIRPGLVTNIAIRTTAIAAPTVQPFIEIWDGATFVRTFLTGAAQAIPPDTVVLIPCTGGPLVAEDRFRVGIDITTEILPSDLFVEVEITFTG